VWLSKYKTLSSSLVILKKGRRKRRKRRRRRGRTTFIGESTHKDFVII
jgi:hypothetical protein